ncbi:MAG: arsenite methyltransferase [Candidatus Lokiarchaeota archaeon]|nr:arsenite methyltransferase [Candidatus Lokiarchaeota archaeon]
MEDNEIKKIVRDQYGKIASYSSCCSPTEEPIAAPSCCGPTESINELGYSIEELKNLPEGANLGLGCGNPTASADLKEGEIILDLGSGAGIDCFLAANKVGISGKVIGVDMTYQMLDKARENAIKGKYENVEFRLGEIENLPVADSTVDVIISNCVINLSTDKKRVYQEAYRVLKPGGRVIVSDIVLLKELPDKIKRNMKAYASCVAGAMLKDDYLSVIKDAGFTIDEVTEQTSCGTPSVAHKAETGEIVDVDTIPKEKLEQMNAFANSIPAISIKVRALKPN